MSLAKVYLAARYERREEMKEYRKVLESYGVEVTSRWLDEPGPPNGDMNRFNDDFYTTTAQNDLDDIDAADGLIFFSENPLEGWKRGGRHVEFGYALGTIPIVVIGPKENVFHHVKGNNMSVVHFETFDDCITDLKNALSNALESLKIGA